jgi:ubiquinone biosynthesis accessory factor UbiK
MEDTLRRIGAALPEGLEQFAQDLRRNVPAAIGAAARKVELVTREEFEVQKGVLARTRERCDALEARLNALEAALASSSASPATGGPGR